MPSEATTILLRGGRLATAVQNDADSLLIEGGRIAWIGAAKDAPRACRTIDLDGSRVVAGLTDAHAHLFMRAQELLNLQLGPGANSIAELLKRLGAACKIAAPDEWVMSADYSEQFLDERRHPTREELDAVSGGRPVLLRRTGGICRSRIRPLCSARNSTRRRLIHRAAPSSGPMAVSTAC